MIFKIFLLFIILNWIVFFFFEIFYHVHEMESYMFVISMSDFSSGYQFWFWFTLLNEDFSQTNQMSLYGYDFLSNLAS